jgi:hypothetical protein
MERQISEGLDTPKPVEKKAEDQKAQNIRAMFESFQAAKEARAISTGSSLTDNPFRSVRRGLGRI